MTTGEMWRRLTFFFRRGQFHRDLEEEMQHHVAMKAQAHLDLQGGISPGEARNAAQREFGNTLLLLEKSRDTWGFAWLETLLQDLRFALRMLRKSPGFTAVAVLTLALGIGANTAIFSVVYGVLLQPLPYRNSSRLVVLNETTPKVGTVSVSYPDFLDWRAQSHAFSQMAATYSLGFNLAGVSQPENVRGDAVSPNFLSMLGVRPLLGSDFEASEENPGTAPVLLLSYALWQSHFGAERSVIGRTITLDGHGFTIIGVLPPNFRSLDKTDVLEPIGVWATNNPSVTDRGDRGDMTILGRLAPGVTLAQARAEMDGLRRNIQQATTSSELDCGQYAMLSPAICAQRCWCSSAR